MNTKKNYLGTILIRECGWDYDETTDFINQLSQKQEDQAIWNLNRLFTNGITVYPNYKNHLFLNNEDVEKLVEDEVEKKRESLTKDLDEKIRYLEMENQKFADCYRTELTKAYEGIAYALSVFESFDLPFDDIEYHVSKAKKMLEDLNIDSDYADDIEKATKYTVINDISLFQVADFSDVEFDDE